MKKILLLLTILLTTYFNGIASGGDYYTKLVGEVDSYIDRISPSSKLDGKVVVDMCLKYDIDIMFVLAQGQIESHFGTTGTARKTNSVFNVGAFDGRSSSAQIKRGFGFEHPNDSVEPYLILLSNNYLVNGISVNNLMYNYVNKYGQRYASHTEYEKMMRSVYNRINKTTNIKHYQSLL
jgi:flagellum-specific peptidoglycan hydrolase FlgJ